MCIFFIHRFSCDFQITQDMPNDDIDSDENEIEEENEEEDNTLMSVHLDTYLDPRLDTASKSVLGRHSGYSGLPEIPEFSEFLEISKNSGIRGVVKRCNSDGRMYYVAIIKFLENPRENLELLRTIGCT